MQYNVAQPTGSLPLSDCHPGKLSRITVEGRLTRPEPAAGLTVEAIGLMMGGAHGMEVAHV